MNTHKKIAEKVIAYIEDNLENDIDLREGTWPECRQKMRRN